LKADSRRNMFIPICRLDGQNVELEAIRALQYEGTPAEIAQGFKEQGNEMTRAKRWKDGQEFYSKGIAVLVQKRGLGGTQHGTSAALSDSGREAEERNESELLEACYVNRALCNLELSESVIRWNWRPSLMSFA